MFFGVGYLLVENGCRRYGLQGVNPRIAHTIGELFFLSPCRGLRQQVGKGLAYNLLLYRLVRTHLRLEIGTHGNKEPPHAERHVRWCERSVNVKVGDKRLRLAFTSYSIFPGSLAALFSGDLRPPTGGDAIVTIAEK